MAAADFLPDFDDDLPTQVFNPRAHALPPPATTANAARGAADESGMRLAVGFAAVPLDQNASLTQLARHQPALAESIALVRARLDKLPRDPSIHAAGRVLATRTVELADVRDSLGEVLVILLRHPDAIDFDFDSVLTDYLDGMRRWTSLVGEAFAFLANELARFDIDWTEARRMLDLAKAERPSASMASVRAHLVMLRDPAARHELTAAFDQVFFTAQILETNLEQRFG